MKRVILFILKAVLFLSILAAGLFGANEILLPKYTLRNSSWPTTSTYKGFYRMQKDSVDVLFLGSSTAVNAFIPQEIYNEYGIRSYNLGSEQQSLFLSYYWLKEALRYQSPKAVVLDTRFMYNVHPEYAINTSEGLTRKCIDPMRFSSVKREAVKAICALDPEQSSLSYYLTNLRYHDRWSSMTAEDLDFSYTKSPLKGYGPIMGRGPDTYTTLDPEDDGSWMEFPALMQEYLDKITELCAEEGIDFLLVSLAGNEMDNAVNNVFTAYAKEHGIQYLNLCTTENYARIGAVLPLENAVGHENVAGAIKTTRLIGKILTEEYHIPSVRDEQYEDSKEIYEKVKKASEISLIDDPVQYLHALASPDYAVFMAADDLSALDEDTGRALHDLFVVTDMRGHEQGAFAAVIADGSTTSDRFGEENVQIKGSFGKPRTKYDVQAYAINGDSAKITVGAKTYTWDIRGLHIVVMETNLGKVIDDVTITGGTIER